MIPASWVQVLILVSGVVPGFVYQIARRALRGPAPDEADITIRILRSVATSALFAGIYFVALGKWLVAALQVHSYYDPRKTAVAALFLVLVVPWLSARVIYYVSTSAKVVRLREMLVRKLHLRRSYDPTPTAWDFAFRDREPGWIRVLSDEGRWIGGWFGPMSFASSYPNSRELFIEISYEMDSDGRFTGAVSGEQGVYIRCDNVLLVEFPTADPDQ